MAKKKSKKAPVKKTPIKGRSTVCISFTGVTGTGKSWKAKEVAKKFSPPPNGKCLVITYAGSGNSWDFCREIAPEQQALSYKKGWRKIIYGKHFSKKKPHCYPILEIFKHFKNGSVIFDDCNMYMAANWENVPGLKQLLNDHRHNGVDLFFIAHQPKHIPKQVWVYIMHSYVFACPFKLTEKDINNANVQKFLDAQAAINEKFKQALAKNGGTKKPVGIYKYLNLTM